MSNFDHEKNWIELSPVGPLREEFEVLGPEYNDLFSDTEYSFVVLKNYSMPSKTTVALTIGIGVITAISSHIIISLFDRVFDIKKKNEPESIEIHISIQKSEDTYILIKNRDQLIQEIKNLKT